MVKNLIMAVVLCNFFMANLYSFDLSEKSLKKLIEDSSPEIKKIELTALSSKYAIHLFNESFSTSMNLSSSYSDSKEKILSAMMPIYGPTSSFSISTSKAFKKGVSLTTELFANQQSTTNMSIDSATTSGLAVSATMDLYNNLFGKLTSLQEKSLNLDFNKANLLKNIYKKTYGLNLFKIYWSLVANQESLNISQKLLKASERQVRQARARQKESIADSGEVARYESQVAARMANITYLKYQKEEFYKALKSYLPEISDQQLNLSDYSLDNTVFEVMKCTSFIQKQNSIPYNFSDYEKIIKIINEKYNFDKLITKTHSNININLNTKLQRIGKEYTYTDSFSDFIDDGKLSYMGGLSISIPLGSAKKNSQKLKQIIEKKAKQAELNEIIAKLKSFHIQTTRSIKLLEEVIANQSQNSKKLSHSLNITKKKYSQARITVRELILDQDSLLQSNLNEIQTKLMVIHTLFDYFSVFNNTPCTINRM